MVVVMLFTVFSSALQDFGVFGMYMYLIILYSIFCGFYYKHFKYNFCIKKEMNNLLIYGSFFNYMGHITSMKFYAAQVETRLDAIDLKLQIVKENKKQFELVTSEGIRACFVIAR